MTQDHLTYRPNKLKVINDPEDKWKVLNEMFNNDRYGIGAGSAFYHVACRKYLNIQRSEVGEFLKRHKVY